MNYHGAVTQEQQQQQYQQQHFQQQLYQHQEQAAMAQQLHYQQQAAYPPVQGYAPPMPTPFMFVNMEMPVSSYQQVHEKFEFNHMGDRTIAHCEKKN